MPVADCDCEKCQLERQEAAEIRRGRAKELASGLAKLDTEYKKEKKGKSEESWSITDSDPELDAVLDDNHEFKEYVKENAATHFKDDEFAWKSDIDGKVFTDESESTDASERWEFDLHEDDPWNAMVVLGLRVYSKGDVKINVVKGDEGERAHRGRMSL